MREEKTIKKNRVYSGKLLALYADTIALPGGGQSAREYVDHPGGVGVVALTDENEIYLVRQYRYALKEAVCEIPAGKIDAGEDPLACGERELREEIKMGAKKWTPLGCAYPSPGCMNETLHLFLAEGLCESPLPEDEDENLEVFKIPFEEAVRLALAGEIRDAKSVIGILKVKMMKENYL